MRYTLPILLGLLSTPCIAETEIILNGISFEVDLAITEDERHQGLMGRTELKDNHGMLFVYDEQQQLSFWMKSTLIPLDILAMANW